MQLVKYLPLFVTCYFLTGCQSTIVNTKQNGISTLTDAETKLKTLISDNSCDATFQCRVIAYGERACGGFSRFDIYSIKTVKQEEVEFLANEITQFEKAYNETTQVFASCEHNPAPQTLCIDNSCQRIEKKR